MNIDTELFYLIIATSTFSLFYSTVSVFRSRYLMKVTAQLYQNLAEQDADIMADHERLILSERIRSCTLNREQSTITLKFDNVDDLELYAIAYNVTDE